MAASGNIRSSIPKPRSLVTELGCAPSEVSKLVAIGLGFCFIRISEAGVAGGRPGSLNLGATVVVELGFRGGAIKASESGAGDVDLFCASCRVSAIVTRPDEGCNIVSLGLRDWCKFPLESLPVVFRLSDPRRLRRVVTEVCRRDAMSVVAGAFLLDLRGLSLNEERISPLKSKPRSMGDAARELSVVRV